MKARKIISFCSMFSLVLILSIYYVLSPIGSDIEHVSNIENNGVVDVEVVDGENAYFKNLDVLKESAYLEEIKLLDAIVASKETSSEEKVAALEAKNNKTKTIENEKLMTKAIKEKGFDNVYVEYENNNVNVLVSKKDATSKDAQIVIEAIYPLIEKGKTPIVTFKG